MENIHECVICDASIWPVAHGHLCYKHRMIHATLSANPRAIEAVRRIERTYFALGAQQPAHQLANRRAHGHWVVQLGDILRAYGVHQEREGGAGHDESEAA